MNQQVQWEVLPRAPDEYLSAYAASPLIAQLLYNRGIKPEEIGSFLAADHRLQGNPFLIPDMSQAVSRIHKALQSREKVAIYGDFDVDGVTATAILSEGLSWLGAEGIPYIPDRFEEGHGVKLAAIEKLQGQGVSLIITVDCCTSNVREVKQAQEKGIDMIITDHHIPSATLPQAIAVVNPKRKDSRYPHPHLAGAGMVFKLLQALFHKSGREKSLNKLLDLVALGTVSDMVPLIGENRYLVKEGLKVLNDTQRLGLQETIRLAGLERGKLDTKHISLALEPRLNAASRIEHASTSYHLLTTCSREEACHLAIELEEKNAERQKLTNAALSKVKEKLAPKMRFPLLIESDESYSLGVIGLVAGKLVDEFHKPAIIIKLGQKICQGSCRSIPEFHLISALDKCCDLSISFGGHPSAAGFTVARQNLAKLEERLMELATSQLSHYDLRPKLVIDAEVPLYTFAGDTFDLIQKLSPFGQGNPCPIFLSRQVEVVSHQNFGSHGEHLELKLKQVDTTWGAIDFNSRKAREEIPSHIDIVYNLEKSCWEGEEALQLILRDFAPSQPHQ